MCPDGEGPGFVADKAGVERANGKVVHAFIGASVVDFGDGHSLTIVAHQQVAGSQVAGSYPTMTLHMERMPRRGADDPPAGQVQVPDASDVLKASLDLADRHWGIQLPFQRRDDFVDDLERFDRFRPLRGEQLGVCGKAGPGQRRGVAHHGQGVECP